jgi:DNA replication and repair protein RecF
LENACLKELFKENIEKDKILARTTGGIHKDDLLFIMNDTPIKPFGSQGQLKSFVLALKLAQYHYLKNRLAIKPILLLDDLFDKLDAQRVGHLLSILHQDEYGQVFITDKDKTMISALLEQISKDYAIFAIDENIPQHSEEE